jgi:hypothetical protein
VKVLGHFLDAEKPPNHRPSLNPKREVEGEKETNKYKQYRANHNNNKHAEDKDLSQGSATPQRSFYVLVVEVTTKVRVSFTSLPLSK